MRPGQWWLVGVLTGALVVWLAGAAWIERERATVTRWQDSTTAAYQTALGLAERQRHAAQLAAQLAHQARQTAEHAADQARDARQAGDRDRARLRASLAVAVTGQDSLPLLVAVVAAQDSQVAQLEVEAGQLRDALRSEVQRSAALGELVAVGDSALALAGQRIASQDSVIRSRLVPTSRGTLFGLPLPSRTVTFVVGLVLGVVATR